MLQIGGRGGGVEDENMSYHLSQIVTWNLMVENKIKDWNLFSVRLHFVSKI